MEKAKRRESWNTVSCSATVAIENDWIEVEV